MLSYVGSTLTGASGFALILQAFIGPAIPDFLTSRRGVLSLGVSSTMTTSCMDVTTLHPLLLPVLLVPPRTTSLSPKVFFTLSAKMLSVALQEFPLNGSTVAYSSSRREDDVSRWPPFVLDVRARSRLEPHPQDSLKAQPSSGLWSSKLPCTIDAWMPHVKSTPRWLH
ncbi:hypothetical protein MRX96_003809 [Rhipicephalus microplus]